jgi:hypothetical protein
MKKNRITVLRVYLDSRPVLKIMRFSTFKIKEVGITTEIAVFHIFDFIFFEIIHSFQYVSNFW